MVPDEVHDRHPGRAAGRGPGRQPRPHRVRPGSVRGRARPPRGREGHQAGPRRPVP